MNTFLPYRKSNSSNSNCNAWKVYRKLRDRKMKETSSPAAEHMSIANATKRPYYMGEKKNPIIFLKVTQIKQKPPLKLKKKGSLKKCCQRTLQQNLLLKLITIGQVKNNHPTKAPRLSSQIVMLNSNKTTVLISQTFIKNALLITVLRSNFQHRRKNSRSNKGTSPHPMNRAKTFTWEFGKIMMKTLPSNSNPRKILSSVD